MYRSSIPVHPSRPDRLQQYGQPLHLAGRGVPDTVLFRKHRDVCRQVRYRVGRRHDEVKRLEFHFDK